MTKTITNIIQNDSGGTNPDTHAHEDKMWELQFEDNDESSLTKMKMLELLTKGTVPTKTAHSFKKWDLTTTLNHTIRTWVVVYDDKSHVQLTNNDFYSLLTNGHRTIDEEPKEHRLPPPNPAIFENKNKLATKKEQLELKEFRRDTMRDNYFPVFGKKEGTTVEE
jgi:hypothetical protein